MGIQCGIVWLVLLFHGFAVAQDLQAYITRKEEQVKHMAAGIVRLHEARCELAANCSSCSRHACTPIEGFQNSSIYDFKCQNMDFNKYCSASSSSNGGCNARKVNYAMSYIRMAPNATTAQVPSEMCSTICMTRDFTSTMKALANVDPYNESFFFGSVEGVHRVFPGEESGNDKCWSYDPRKRPWYNGAISIQKHLNVLIDHGYNSQYQVLSPLLSAVDASKRLVRELMYTLSPKDIINLVPFNETNADALLSYPVLVPDDVGLGLTGQMQILVDNIDNIRATQQSIGVSSQGFIKGILSALQPDNYGGNYLKVIMLVTNGEFATDLKATDIQQVSQMLKNHSTQLLIYSYGQSDNLRALANASGGYFEYLNSNFDNPLYQINSFFNFMALARNASLNNTPYWTKFYVDFEGLGSIITVSYQAISPEGHLVGVTAIDIVLQSMLTNLPNALGDRSASRPTNPNASASIVEATNSICQFCDGSRALCGMTSNKTLTDLIRCDTCDLVVAPPPEIFHHGGKIWTTRKIIIAAVVPGSVLVLAFVILLVLLRKRYNTTLQSPERPMTSGGIYDVGPYS